MVKIKIYTTPTCSWCKKTKEFLKGKKISFTEVNVAEDQKAQGEMVELSGQTGVPVIDIEGEILVGFDPDMLMEAIENAGKEK